MFIPPKRTAITRKSNDDFLEPADVVFNLERKQEVQKLIIEYLVASQQNKSDETRDLFSHYVYILSKPETSYKEYEATYKKAKTLINS